MKFQIDKMNSSSFKVLEYECKPKKNKKGHCRERDIQFKKLRDNIKFVNSV
jgi:hypothetical protein